MKTRFITALFAAASLLAGCSKETTGPGDTDDSRIPITFTLATPGSEGVIYPRSATRATHDAAEYAVRQLTLLVYDATDTSAPKFLRKHDMTSDITLYDNGNGTYTFSLEAPISDMNAKRKFVFVVNDDAAVAATAAGSAEADLHETAATVELADGDTADKLAEADAGIAMSGTATADGQNEVITIVPGVKCEVKLTRIVARVDVQNNTPNMTLESAVLVGAATRGYLFAQAPLSAPVADRIVLGSNATVDLTEEHPALKPGEVFAPKTFRKTFYAYERPNTAGDYAAVRITYRVNDSKGTVEVPFIRTEAGGAQTPVDIERNHLYTVVLGNGKPVTTNEVQFTFKVEDWNTVEMPEEIGPGDPLDPKSQQKLNAALKVNMFTPFNAKSVDLGTKKINSFFDKLTVSADDCPTDSYFTYTELKDAGLTAADAVLTDGEGNEYRLPTEAEWEYAARGGLSGAKYPWGGPYTRNKKGCFLANFKPLRGNYISDGGFTTVPVGTYEPNGFGLYDMAGNVAEWTGDAFDESAYQVTHDLSPYYQITAKKSDNKILKRKVIRGGSWKDIAYFMQCGVRTYEYADSARSFIGFRTVRTRIEY